MKIKDGYSCLMVDEWLLALVNEGSTTININDFRSLLDGSEWSSLLNRGTSVDVL